MFYNYYYTSFFFFPLDIQVLHTQTVFGLIMDLIGPIILILIKWLGQKHGMSNLKNKNNECAGLM